MKTLLFPFAFLMIIISSCGDSFVQKNQSMILLTESSSDTITMEDLLLLKQIASIRFDLSIESQKITDNLSLIDRKKSAGIISELLNRAEQNILGELPEGRYVWSWQGFENPTDMVNMAKDFLDSMSLEKNPFLGLFFEPGGNVIDHAIIEKDGLFHLIYIRAVAVSNWPEYPSFNFGHAVSGNLVDWDIKDPVLQTVEEGEGFDTYQVWAPHIIKHQGKYWNFYTGVNDSVSQAICLATSDDLYNWERYDANPIITSLPWGAWSETAWSDCRDPMVLKDGDVFYCYYTAARVNPDTDQTESCLGVASSKDLLNWKDEGFRRLEHTLTTPPESPFVVKRKGEYYLFYTNYKYGIVYVKSDDPLIGWKENPDDPQSILEGVSATEIFEKDGEWYITLISHMDNGLHFLEIRELLWHEDGTVSVGREIK